MAVKDDIAPSDLRQLLRYEPENGHLYWLDGGERACKRDTRGYYAVSLAGSRYRAHRVAWAIYHGEWPRHEIDHINGVRDDNRIANLRDASPSENRHNMRLSPKNKSGVNGVHWCKRKKKWEVSMKVQNKTIYLGRYQSLEDAAAAREAANQKHGFHPNHGKPAISQGNTNA